MFPALLQDSDVAVLVLTLDKQYDTLTTPITTSHFHSRVLTLLSSHLSNLQPAAPDSNGTTATTQNTRPLVIPVYAPSQSPVDFALRRWSYSRCRD